MTISVIAVIILFIFILLGLPISYTLFMTGFGGICLLRGFNVANSIVHYKPLGGVISGEVSTLPLFILIGAFALSAGVATDGYKVARKWLGRLPGGLGIATITASAGFAACSGSSIAGAVTMGKLAIPEMRANRYSDSLSAGVCGAGGLLASMIPPSGMMVLYGLASNESIGKLLIAGIVPGMLIALSFVIGIIVKAKLDPKSAPLATEVYSWGERFRAIPKVWGVLVIFGTIFIGIFSGVFTATESAAWGSLIALGLLGIKAKKGFKKEFFDACIGSAVITVSLFFLVLGAYVFSSFLIIAGLPQAIQQTVAGADMPGIYILLIMISTYVILGMFMDGVTITLLTVPIYYPIVLQLGYSGLWFGVIVVAMIEIGQVSPPFGLTAYTINAIAPEINLVEIFKGSSMFLFLELAVVILLLFFPQLALWLPSLMN